MVVQHNISAMTANRYYGVNNKGLASSLEKLASGYAINKAGDNAAGLAVSEKMRAQIGGLTQASKNAEEGISMVQTFEGALQETDSILQRMRTLAVQSANGSYQNDVDRDAIQLEFDQLNDELNQIADTDYNGVVTLNGGVMADGTVVNDPSKVAKRPNIEQVETSPDAAFTYKSIVNGTVNTAGTGSLSINGVSLELEKGKGSTTLGNDANGYTTYSTEDITVTNNGGENLVNGTISAQETYKIDNKTTDISIHGQSYTISGTKLIDSEGNTKSTIDGMIVSIDEGSQVTLTGKYNVVDNKVETGSAFDAKNGLGGFTDKDGEGTISVNNTVITLSGGAGTATDKGDPNITYTAANIKLANGLVGGNVTASGTAAINTVTDTTDKVSFTKVNVASGMASADWGGAAGSGGNTKPYQGTSDVYSFTIKGKTVYTDGTDFYTAPKANSDASKINDVEAFFTNKFVGGFALDKDGNIVDAADDTAVTKYTLNGTLDADGGNAFDTEEFTLKAGGDTFKLNYKKDKWADGTTADKTLTSRDGLKVEVGGTIKGTLNANVKPTDPVQVGNFKVSKGVSTSNAYNHGNANLTYADSITLQVGARAKDAVNFNFSYTTNGIGNLKSDMNASARGLGTDQLKVNNQEDANFAIDQIDNAINKVNMIRSTFGSIQNRLEHKINNIDTNTENLTASESRIRDTQMDKEMMKFTSNQILSQASQSMLAQANQLPQGVLQLLG